MHYLIHVFTDPGASVEDAMEPYRKYEEGGRLIGYWTWWMEGGRWSGKFDGRDQATAEEVSAMKLVPSAPYAFVTCEGEWVAQEIRDGDNWSPVPGYEDRYRAYLTSVPRETIVTIVDIHP